MNADIIGFQEVFHIEALEELLKHTNEYAEYNLVSTVGQEPNKRPFVALASKYEIVESQVYASFPSVIHFDEGNVAIDKFSRPVLRCKIKTDDFGISKFRAQFIARGAYHICATIENFCRLPHLQRFLSGV